MYSYKSKIAFSKKTNEKYSSEQNNEKLIVEENFLKNLDNLKNNFENFEILAQSVKKFKLFFDDPNTKLYLDKSLIKLELIPYLCSCIEKFLNSPYFLQLNLEFLNDLLKFLNFSCPYKLFYNTNIYGILKYLLSRNYYSITDSILLFLSNFIDGSKEGFDFIFNIMSISDLSKILFDQEQNIYHSEYSENASFFFTSLTKYPINLDFFNEIIQILKNILKHGYKSSYANIFQCFSNLINNHKTTIANFFENDEDIPILIDKYECVDDCTLRNSIITFLNVMCYYCYNIIKYPICIAYHYLNDLEGIIRKKSALFWLYSFKNNCQNMKKIISHGKTIQILEKLMRMVEYDEFSVSLAAGQAFIAISLEIPSHYYITLISHDRFYIYKRILENIITSNNQDIFYFIRSLNLLFNAASSQGWFQECLQSFDNYNIIESLNTFLDEINNNIPNEKKNNEMENQFNKNSDNLELSNIEDKNTIMSIKEFIERYYQVQKQLEKI